MMRPTNRLLAAPLFVGGLLLLAGCSRPGKKVEDYTPPADNAKQALEAALNYWKAGNPPGTVPDTKPPVEVEDAKWKAAPKQLRDFEILGEDERPTDAVPRYFKVKLTMISGPPQEVRYVVFGIDPLHVYREQDYDKLSGAGK